MFCACEGTEITSQSREVYAYMFAMLWKVEEKIKKCWSHYKLPVILSGGRTGWFVRNVVTCLPSAPSCGRPETERVWFFQLLASTVFENKNERKGGLL